MILSALKINLLGRSLFYCRITESQNVRGWKGPLWVTQPNPLPKQGHLQQAAWDFVQEGQDGSLRDDSRTSVEKRAVLVLLLAEQL